MWNYLLVAVGGALGSMARYWCSGFVARHWGEAFPWGTLAVNVTGSFLIGFLAALGAPAGRVLLPPAYRNFLMVGFCGGYTTFSSFSLQTLSLAQNAEMGRAALNSGLSLVLCLAAVWLGLALGRSLNALDAG